MPGEVCGLPATELSRMYEDGSLSPVEVAQASLDRAEKYASLNVLVRPPDHEQILSQARQSETRWLSKSARGELDGVPLTELNREAW